MALDADGQFWRSCCCSRPGSLAPCRRPPPRKRLPLPPHPPRPSPTPSRRPPPARTCSARRWPVSSRPGQWRDLAQRVTALEADLDALDASATAKAELIDADRRSIVSCGCCIARFGHRRRPRAHRPAARARRQRARVGRPEMAGASVVSGEAAAFPRRSSSVRDRSRRSCNARVLASGNTATTRCSRSTARWRCRRASTTRARSSRRSRSASARNRTQLEQSPLWQLGAAPAQFELVAAELRAAWRCCETTSRAMAPDLPGCSSASWR